MSLSDVVARMSEIQALAGQTLAPAGASQLEVAASAFHGAVAELSSPDDLAATDAFSSTDTLGPTEALSSMPAPAVPAPAAFQPAASTWGGTSAGPRALAVAETQVGVTEQPPGSNDGPQLAEYRSAVAGAAPGEPWCAYFASWAAAQAGVPLGDSGEGLGSVAQITDWAGRTGRLLPSTATPAPGDLILFGDRHVGIVESVNADGSLTTVEGNYANAVSRVHRSPAEATGYVRL